MPWEDVKTIFRPETVHVGVMKVDEDACTACGLCLENCPLRAWEADENGIPHMKQQPYECFSCFNCMVCCPTDAISIAETYHVHEGFFATDPHPLPVKPPAEPRDAEGRLTEWNVVERTVFERRSVRNYRNKSVPESLIKRVLEAGRFAPSAGNCQPWRFIVITDKALINQLDQAICAGLRQTYSLYSNDETVKNLAAMYEASPARAAGSYDPRVIQGGMGSISKNSLPVFLNAPVVILILGDDRAISGPQINVGICGQNMNLVAKSLGLGACWIGFSQVISMIPPLMDKLGIKPPWRVTSAVALGYPRFKQEGIVSREFRPITWFREGAASPEVEE